MVYFNGHPAIVDVGRGEYNRKVFSDDRYDVWWVRGRNHNAPVINGREQISGNDGGLPEEVDHYFTSREVDCANTQTHSRLAMELRDIYGPDTGIQRVDRVCTLDRAAGQITVADAIRLDSGPVEAVLTLYSDVDCEQLEPGLIRMHCGDTPLLMKVEADNPKAELETVAMDEEELIHSWGDRLTRITLTLTADSPELDYTLTFSPEEAAATPPGTQPVLCFTPKPGSGPGAHERGAYPARACHFVRENGPFPPKTDSFSPVNIV
ncbi:hypothetical protein [Mucisphaera calidilacus]|uniref:Uncharacterized protein n=1 Tax=Mucisphaera calidilacus TaxID=2527982 RepID=A0A518BUH9_9BACT|nr:hypothetical protein Pan265_04120 [Mucisphaera calidilacus]